MAALFFKNIFQFYRYDSCWPYSASFFLALAVYWLDFFIVNSRYPWASLAAYAVILAYYLRNTHLYHKGRIKARNAQFFIQFLSAKIIIWGCLLLYFIKTRILSCSF